MSVHLPGVLTIRGRGADRLERAPRCPDAWSASPDGCRRASAGAGAVVSCFVFFHHWQSLGEPDRAPRPCSRPSTREGYCRTSLAMRRSSPDWKSPSLTTGLIMSSSCEEPWPSSSPLPEPISSKFDSCSTWAMYCKQRDRVSDNGTNFTEFNYRLVSPTTLR